VEFKNIGLIMFSFRGRVHYYISTSLNPRNAWALSQSSPQGKLLFPARCPLLDIYHTFKVTVVTALQAALVPATAIFFEKYVTITFRTALKPPHLSIAPFRLSPNQPPPPLIPHRFLCASLC
jgi:hypothetical protein